MRGYLVNQRCHVVAGVLVTIAILSGCSSASPTDPPRTNQLQLVDDVGTAWSVQIEDPAALAAARRMVGTAELRWFHGAIRPGDGGNAPWSWHLDPATVEVADVTIEVCQATVSFTQETLDYWLAYGRVCILSRVTR